MQRSSCESWSISRSLAFVAATFAIALAICLPTAVAASPAVGTPILLCSGEQMLVAFDEDGGARPQKPSGLDSLTCASCVLAALTSLPPPPPVRPAPAPHIASVQTTTLWSAQSEPVCLVERRPPSTAPPIV